jgi:hypothetical protein
MLLACFTLVAQVSEKSNFNPFPDDCWGVYTWFGDFNAITPDTHPHIKGIPIVTRWSEVELEKGKFAFEEVIGKKLEILNEKDFNTFIMTWASPGDRVPRWLYENGVPELEMTKTINPQRKVRDWTFPYYFDEDYVFYFQRMLKEFASYLKTLPDDLRNRVLFIQSAEGSTGDGYCYKGKPLNPKYNISREEWGGFRIRTWEVLREELMGEYRRMIIPLLVNYDANREEEYKWLMNKLNSAVGLKNGMFSHGYHISGGQERLKNWRSFQEKLNQQDRRLFSRGEMDAEWNICGWSKQHPAEAFYWSSIYAIHCGIDMWNIPHEAVKGDRFEEAFIFFNKYAGKSDPSTSDVAFCALRKGIDASDTEAFPESEFGDARKSNVQRYIKIANHYKSRGAMQGDPEKATGGGMKNRQRDEYNDVGWKILPGNYDKYLKQIQPDETSAPWWHVGSKNSIYGRFARGFNHQKQQDTLFFKLHDDFFNSTDAKSLKVKVIWFDHGNGSWKLEYDAEKKGTKAAGEIKVRGSGKWREAYFTLKHPAMKQNGPRGSDLMLVNTGNSDIIFHLIEVSTKN